MATATKSTSTDDVVQDTVDRIRDLNERIIDSAKTAGTVQIDAYEKTLNGVADFQEKVADASQVEWITTLANAQATLVRDVTSAYTKAARGVIK